MSKLGKFAGCACVLDFVDRYYITHVEEALVIGHILFIINSLMQLAETCGASVMRQFKQASVD